MFSTKIMRLPLFPKLDSTCRLIVRVFPFIQLSSSIPMGEDVYVKWCEMFKFRIKPWIDQINQDVSCVSRNVRRKLYIVT